MVLLQMTRTEFDRRTQESRDFLRLCEMAEFKNTIVKFFDQQAESIHNKSVLEFHPDQIRDVSLMLNGQNQVLERYKELVAQWIADQNLSLSEIEIIEES